jgi:hypothetical protein
MIISVRQVSRFMRMLVFIVLFSFISYKVLGIVHEMITPANKYKEPTGNDAVKVVSHPEEETETGWDEVLSRLSEFYQIGE